MLATRELIDSFHAFAVEQLRNGADPLTIDELYGRWRQVYEREETVRAVHCSIAQIERGECMTLEEAEQRIQEKLRSASSQS